MGEASLETIAEEPALGPGPLLPGATPPSHAPGGPQCSTGLSTLSASPPRVAVEAPRPLQLQTGSHASAEPAPGSRQWACSTGGPAGACKGAPSGHIEGKGHPRALGHVPRRAKSEGQVPSESLGGRWPLAGPCPQLRGCPFKPRFPSHPGQSPSPGARLSEVGCVPPWMVSREPPPPGGS